MQTLLLSLLFAGNTVDNLSTISSSSNQHQFSLGDNDNINDYKPGDNDANLNINQFCAPEKTSFMPLIGEKDQIIYGYPFLVVKQCQSTSQAATYMFSWKDKDAKCTIGSNEHGIIKYFHEKNILTVMHLTLGRIYLTMLLGIEAPFQFDQARADGKKITDHLLSFAKCVAEIESLSKINTDDLDNRNKSESMIYENFEHLPSGGSCLFEPESMLLGPDLKPIIFSIILANKRLKYLDLSASTFDENTARELGKTLINLDTPLEKLDLANTNITSEWFRKAMPRPYKQEQASWFSLLTYLLYKLNEGYYKTVRLASGKEVVAWFYDFSKFPKIINLYGTSLTPDVQKEWIETLQEQSKIQKIGSKLTWEKVENNKLIRQHESVRIENEEPEPAPVEEQPTVSNTQTNSASSSSSSTNPQIPGVVTSPPRPASAENTDHDISPVSAFSPSFAYDERQDDEKEEDLDKLVKEMEAAVNE